MYKSITHIGLKVNKPRQNETSIGEGEKYNFYGHSDIKEKVVIINITPHMHQTIRYTCIKG